MGCPYAPYGKRLWKSLAGFCNITVAFWTCLCRNHRSRRPRTLPDTAELLGSARLHVQVVRGFRD